MTEPMETERYCVCPTCRSRFAFPSLAQESTFILRCLDGDAPGIAVRGIVYCGNCGASFMPDIAGYIRIHASEIAGEVRYVAAEDDTRSRWRRNLPPTIVPCEVSGRYLRFHPDSSRMEGGEFISVDVMTTVETEEGTTKERKLCVLIVTREDMVKALDTVRAR